VHPTGRARSEFFKEIFAGRGVFDVNLAVFACAIEDNNYKEKRSSTF